MNSPNFSATLHLSPSTKQDALQTLTSPDSSREDKVEALEIVAEECEDINVAQDFAKLGGMPLLLEWLGSGDAEILAHAASVVASLTQNNPGGLADVQAHNIFPFLRPLLRHEDEKVGTFKECIELLTRSGGSPLFLSFH